jgi:hypothetical protein
MGQMNESGSVPEMFAQATMLEREVDEICQFETKSGLQLERGNGGEVSAGFM